MIITAEQIEDLIQPVLQQEAARLCGVRISGRASRPHIQIFVDWEEDWITIDACAKITRALLDLFDMQERFALDYRLEVSSPGLDWPLSEVWQFRKNIGRVIGVRNTEGEFEAKLLDVTADGTITVEIAGETKQMSVPELTGAKLVLFPKSSTKSGRKRNEARSR